MGKGCRFEVCGVHGVVEWMDLRNLEFECPT